MHLAKIGWVKWRVVWGLVKSGNFFSITFAWHATVISEKSIVASAIELAGKTAMDSLD
jgi:hypothetical protein